jgi:parvulin-like peptidyl-prolyl isomerase
MCAFDWEEPLSSMHSLPFDIHHSNHKRKGSHMKKLLLFCLLLLFACSTNKPPQDAAIKVNTKWLMKKDIDKILDMYTQQMMRMMPQQALEGGMPPEVRKNMIRQYIAQELLQQEAKKRNIAFDQVRLDKMFDDIKKKFPDSTAFQLELTRMGETEKSIREQLKDGLMVDSLARSLFTKLAAISDERCKAYYDSNKVQYSGDKKIRVSQILFLNKKEMGPQEQIEQLEKAKKLAAELKKGKNFAAAVKEYSQDAASIKEGGDIGWFKRGDMPPDFESVAMALKKNEVSDAFQTQIGVHILKKTAEELLPAKLFEEVKGQIKTMIEIKERNGVMKNFIDSLWNIAKIEYADTTYEPLKGSMPTPSMQ